jgi:hypothetical protein
MCNKTARQTTAVPVDWDACIAAPVSKQALLLFVQHALLRLAALVNA